jgi:ferritin
MYFNLTTHLISLLNTHIKLEIYIQQIYLENKLLTDYLNELPYSKKNDIKNILNLIVYNIDKQNILIETINNIKHEYNFLCNVLKSSIEFKEVLDTISL